MVTRSYVKINDPKAKEEALKALRALSIDMHEVCVMDTTIALGGPEFNTQTGIIDFFGGGMQTGEGKMTKERCATIISNSSEKLGEYDFFFEWFEEPTKKQIDTLNSKIDETLKPLGVKYTITTKK